MNVLNKVKAINERLSYMEKHGMTGTATYQSLLDWMEIEGIETTLSKTGQPRISRSKSNLAYFETMSGKEALIGGSEISWKNERRQAKNILKSRGIKNPSASEIVAEAENYYNLEKWVDENLTTVYEFRKEISEAEELASMFEEGIRPLDYATIFNAIRKFETARDKWLAEAKKSDYAKAGETVMLQSDGNPYKKG